MEEPWGSDLEEVSNGGDMTGTGTFPGIWHIIPDLTEGEREREREMWGYEMTDRESWREGDREREKKVENVLQQRHSS